MAERKAGIKKDIVTLKTGERICILTDADGNFLQAIKLDSLDMVEAKMDMLNNCNTLMEYMIGEYYEGEDFEDDCCCCGNCSGDEDEAEQEQAAASEKEDERHNHSEARDMMVKVLQALVEDVKEHKADKKDAEMENPLTLLFEMFMQ